MVIRSPKRFLVTIIQFIPHYIYRTNYSTFFLCNTSTKIPSNGINKQLMKECRSFLHSNKCLFPNMVFDTSHIAPVIMKSSPDKLMRWILNTFIVRQVSGRYFTGATWYTINSNHDRYVVNTSREVGHRMTSRWIQSCRVTGLSIRMGHIFWRNPENY